MHFTKQKSNPAKLCSYHRLTFSYHLSNNILKSVNILFRNEAYMMCQVCCTQEQSQEYFLWFSTQDIYILWISSITPHLSDSSLPLTNKVALGGAKNFRICNQKDAFLRTFSTFFAQFSPHLLSPNYFFPKSSIFIFFPGGQRVEYRLLTLD